MNYIPDKDSNVFPDLFDQGVGAGSLWLPSDSAFLVGDKGQRSEVHSFYLQMHYTNVLRQSGRVDRSGLRIWFDTVSRPKLAGVMLLGLNGLVWDDIPARTPFVHRQVTCPSGCTKGFADNITVFSSFLHGHTFLKQIVRAITSEYPSTTLY
jgi:hypothetical protein